MRENKTCPYDEWKRMPTQELDQVLQAELKKEYPNEEVVLPILHELEEREGDCPIEQTHENLVLLEKLKERNASSKQSKRNRGWAAGLVAAAAVVCVIVMAMPWPVGAESVMDMIVRWTSSVFEFVDPNKNEIQPKPYGEFVTDNTGLQRLYDNIADLGVTEPVVPMWLPDGFVLTDLKVHPMPGGNNVHGKFENGSQIITITYRISTEITTSFEKEETGVELFESSDVSHFIVDNDDNLSATWTVDGVKCLLSADVSKEEVYSIIKSIYRSELS